ncbi:MAG TPA: ATP synthase F1 subunit delta [Polyangiales bacterium]|nr:ATP synthase F1 subunit delta [Polyangiales bacterium]
MSVASLARRYARAVLELATEANAVEETGKQLSEFAALWNGSDELRAVFHNPEIAPEQRKAILADVAQRVGLSTLTRNSVLYIADRGRIAALPLIARAFSDLSEGTSGIVRAEVTSAAPLSDVYYAQLQKTLEQVTGHKVSIEKKTDPSLIAGVVTRVGDKVYDGSIKTRLEDLSNSLRGA